MGSYSIKPDGAIFCRNQMIGNFDISTGFFALDIEVPPVGLTHIKAQAYDLMMARQKDRTKDKPYCQKPPTSDNERGKTLIEVFKEDEAKAHEQMSSLLGPASREEYASHQPPPPPPMDPRLGDKTPAWMEWLGHYFPEEFKKRFKGRKTHLTTGINPHLSTGDVPESHFAKEAAEEWR